MKSTCSIITVCVSLLGSLAAAMAADLPETAQLPPRPGLPDPLVMFDGTPVTTPEQWREWRRPELKTLFQHYMYGYLPPAPPREQMRFVTEQEDPNYLGGKAIKKLVTIHAGPPGAPPLHLLLIVPHSRKPAPVFLGLNFGGNHSVLSDPTIPLPEVWMYPRPGTKNNRATDAGRGTQVDVWVVERIIDRGYALATCYSGDIDPDKPDFNDGIHPHYYKPGQTKPGKHEWGTIAAWAWGLHRLTDYLVTDPLIDSKRIAVVGHSRLGKTALLAAALDERVALVIPHQAGCGGTAPSRGTVGESVKRINDVFPHWFNDAFTEFNEQVDRLPFDQHCLIALVAPRPVLLSNAVEDEWANPAGQFQMLQAADPVYRLLGVEGLAANQMPPPGTLMDSRLGYFIRPGKHSMGAEDWEAFLAFADKHLGNGARAGRN